MLWNTHEFLYKINSWFIFPNEGILIMNIIWRCSIHHLSLESTFLLRLFISLSLHFLSFLRSSATFPKPSFSRNIRISYLLYFFLVCPAWLYSIKIDNAFENYFLNYEVMILSLKTLLHNLFTKLPCRVIIPSSSLWYYFSSRWIWSGSVMKFSAK